MSSPLTAESLLHLNTFVFNLRHIALAVIRSGNDGDDNGNDCNDRSDSPAAMTWAAQLCCIFCDTNSRGASNIDALKIAMAMAAASAADHAILAQSTAGGCNAISLICTCIYQSFPRRSGTASSLNGLYGGLLMPR